MTWIALYSQTGSELTEICKNLGKDPDVILSNNKKNDKFKTHQEIEDYLMSLDSSLVTLHGYLRILSPEVCNHHQVINGHPGPIHKYSDLKGKDPQIRWFNDKDSYSIMGSVIHEVIPEVDEGKILAYSETSSKPSTLDDTYTQLKDMSINMWVNLLKGIL